MHLVSSHILGCIRVLAAAAAMLLVNVLHAQCGASWNPASGGDPLSAPRGIVNATTNWDPDGAGPLPTNFVVGGRMAVADTALCTVALHDGSRWTALPRLSNADDDEVMALAVFNNQLVAVARDRVARWNAFGNTWVTIGLSTSVSPVSVFKAAAVFQNDLYVGGIFGNVVLPGSVAVNARGIARWDGTNWSSVGTVTAASTDVRALTVFNNNLLAGGAFASMGGVSATNLASWNGTSWSAFGNPNAAVDSLGVRSAVALTATQLFAGGRFTSIGGVSAQGVARIAALVGSNWNAMSGLPASYVTDGVSLFVRGVGTSAFECNAGTGSTVQRWNGSSWTQVFEVAPARVSCLTLQGGQLTAGVHALEFDDPSKSNLALRRADGTTLHGQGIRGNVLAVGEFNGQTVIAGDFQQIDGTTVNGVAIGSAGNWQPLGNGVTGGVGKVRAIAAVPGSLLVGGDFTLATGGVADRIAAWNGTAWVPVVGGADGPVHALVATATGNTVYAGGAFTSIAGVNARGLAQLRGSVWSAVGGGLNGNAGNPVVDHLGIFNEFLAVGGTFTTVGTTNIVANNVARLRVSNATWEALTRTGATAPGVPELDVLATIGSSFVIAYPSNDPAWQSIDIAVGTTLEPLRTVPGSVLRVTELQTAKLVHGSPYYLYRGQFQEIRGTTTTTFTGSLVRGAGTLDEPFPLSLLGGVRGSLSFEADGDLIVGGMARAVETSVRGGVGRLAANCPTGSLSFGVGCGTATNPTPLVSSVSLPAWTGESLGVRTTNFSPGSLGIAVLGFLPTATPLSLILPGGGGPCNLIVDPVTNLTLTVPPAGGTVFHTVAIPASTSLAGVSVLDQVLQLTVGPAGIDGLGASQGIRFTIGVRF